MDTKMSTWKRSAMLSYSHTGSNYYNLTKCYMHLVMVFDMPTSQTIHKKGNCEVRKSYCDHGLHSFRSHVATHNYLQSTYKDSYSCWSGGKGSHSVHTTSMHYMCRKHFHRAHNRLICYKRKASPWQPFLEGARAKSMIYLWISHSRVSVTPTGLNNYRQVALLQAGDKIITPKQQVVNWLFQGITLLDTNKDMMKSFLVSVISNAVDGSGNDLNHNAKELPDMPIVLPKRKPLIIYLQAVMSQRMMMHFLNSNSSCILFLSLPHCMMVYAIALIIKSLYYHRFGMCVIAFHYIIQRSW